MIGRIIKDKRSSKGLTQKQLAEGICTDKYIYLIETEQRNPSVWMLHKLSEKLNIDLFDYYQYLNFENPSIVIEYKEKFKRCIQLSDIQKLKKIAKEAAQHTDFKSEPLSYDILVINLFYKGIMEGQKESAIKELKDLLQKKFLQIDPLTFINGHVALSSIYQINNQLDEAKKILLLAYQLIKNKDEYSRYHVTYINVLISLSSLLQKEKNYDELIIYSKELLSFQEKYNEYNRMYYAEFYLALGYYKKNKFVDSKYHFYRSLQLMSLFKCENDYDHISNTDVFPEMIKYFVTSFRIE